MESKIINSSPGKKQKTDWNKLWLKAKTTFEVSGMSRQKAILENFKNQKEEICRILNIVSEADLARIHRRIEQSSSVKG